MVDPWQGGGLEDTALGGHSIRRHSFRRHVQWSRAQAQPHHRDEHSSKVSPTERRTAEVPTLRSGCFSYTSNHGRPFPVLFYSYGTYTSLYKYMNIYRTWKILRIITGNILNLFRKLI